VGTQTLAAWKGYAGFLYRAGALSDSDGHRLSRPPAYAAYFTNAYLPAVR
jgi:hypothetical protein